ncbi:hypothetical protein [Paenibacillus xylaniclasticus]|uniref:hypothetical protein n=1 Tax=Paenibacillus xylaniclasticus TaxID=588083 RepID=UPI000FD8244C|nr:MULTISPECIES: hypothetical protein [Paenibacillus]GFN29998.1 hypothetical protein PCURB6_02580 [Paenibacillus curdlanolyticus]
MNKKKHDKKPGKSQTKSGAKQAKGVASSPAPVTATATPSTAEQLQQTYGNNAVLKYLQSGLIGQMSIAPGRYEGQDSGANMSKVGGKPLSVEQAEAFASAARPPTAEEILLAKREEKKKDDLVAWKRIRKDKEIMAAIEEASELTGIEAATLEKMIIVESSGIKNKSNGSYHGLMQIGHSAFKDVRDKGAMKKLFDTLTIKDADSGEERAITWDDVKTDARANVLVGAIYAKGNLNRIQAHNKEVNKKRSEQSVLACLPDAPASYAESAADPREDGFLLEESAQNLYFAHQQGFNGMRNIYKNPDAAIGANQRGNMTPFDREHYTQAGPGEQITNAEFVEAWKERMKRIDEFMMEEAKEDD